MGAQLRLFREAKQMTGDSDIHAGDQLRPVGEALQILRDMLRRSGIDPDGSLTFGSIWNVFKEFADIPFDAQSDQVFYNAGAFSLLNPGQFTVTFGLGFEFRYDDGDYDHAEGIMCEFSFPDNEQTQSFGKIGTQWFSPVHGPDPPVTWSEFVATIEGRPEFIALRDITPQSTLFSREEV